MWQVELSEAELVAAGWTSEVTPPGTYTWTFANGRATIEMRAEGGERAYCEAEMVLDHRLIRLNYAGFDCGDEKDVVMWELADDGLHLLLISTNAPRDQQKAYLETEPWQRVDG